MPTIPFAGDRLVQPQALPGVRQSISTDPAMFGGAQGRGMQAVAQGIEGAANGAEKIAGLMDQEDTRKAREAWANAQAATENLTDEYRARKGVDVAPKDKPTASQEYGDKLKDVYGKSTQGLSPGARVKFDSMWGPYATVRQGLIDRHQKTELDNVDVANSEVNIGNAQKDWAVDPSNQDAVAEAKRRIGAEAAYLGSKKGWSPEVVKERFDAEVTKGHLNSVSALMAADRAGDAQAYYDRYRDEVDPRVRDGIEAKLKQQTEVTKSQESADQLWAKHGGDLTKALDEARKTHSGTLEEKVVEQLKVRSAEADHAKVKIQHASFNAALDKIINAPSASEALTAAMKADVEPDLRLRLVNVANGMQRAENGQAGNPAGLVEVMELVDQGKLGDPKNVQAAAAERNLSKKEIGDAVKYLQQGGLAGEVKMTEITRLAKEWKKDVKPEELGLLSQYIIDDLKKQAPGKPITPEDLSQRVAGYMWKGETSARVVDGKVVKPGWWVPGLGWDETAMQARKTGGIDSWLPDVTSDEWSTLRAELSDLTGLPPEKIDMDAIRVFKKQKAGLPLGAQQQTKALPRAPKAVAAPPSTGPSARGRNAAQAAASLLDNSGQD